MQRDSSWDECSASIVRTASLLGPGWLLLHNQFSWLTLTQPEVPCNPPPHNNTTDSSISWYESAGARSRVTRPYWSRSSSQPPITTSRIKCVSRTAVRRRYDMSVTASGWQWVGTVALCIQTEDGNPFIDLSHREILLKARYLQLFEKYWFLCIAKSNVLSEV